MESANEKKYLEVPKVRKSHDVLRDIRSLSSNTNSPMSSPQATSTVERRTYSSLTDPHLNILYEKPTKNETPDSSLGLIDIEHCKGFTDDSITKVNSSLSKATEDLENCSFNPKEISGRSTSNVFSAIETSKENNDPSKIPIAKFSSNSEVNEIIQRAKRQSLAVDSILKSSTDPASSKKWEIMDSFRNSLADPVGGQKCNETRPYDSNTNRQSQSVSESIGDMFSENKINMSMAELSWMKEKGELPVSIAKNSTVAFHVSPENEAKSIGRNSEFSYANDTKLSMGNYFKEGCVDIKDFLDASSPEKRSCAPLYTSNVYKTKKAKNMDETYDKGLIDEEPSRNDINNENKEYSLSQTTKGGLSDTTNIDDTISSAPLSLTQIRNIVGKLDAERPSIIIDNMLGIKNAKKKNMQDSQDTFRAPSMPKNASNIFHSTKNPQSHQSMEELHDKTSLRLKESFMKLSPIAEKKHDSNNERYSSINGPNDTEKTSSNISKNTKTSSSSGVTGNSIDTTKSAVTVIQGKHSNFLRSIEEHPHSGYEEVKSDHRSAMENSRSNLYSDMSPGIKSVSNEKCIFTPSDVTNREIKEIMSSESFSNAEGVFRSPPSGRHVKRLIDHYQCSKVMDDNEEVWISPTQAKINDLSNECIASVTPLRVDNIKKMLPNRDSENDRESDMKTHVNYSGKGNLVKIESSDLTVLSGVTTDLKLQLTSLDSGWLTVNFSVGKVYIDERLYEDDIRRVILIQAPLAKILLNPDSSVECVLKLTCVDANPSSVRIALNVQLTDMVTQQSSTLEHEVRARSERPRVHVRDLGGSAMDILEFPIVPERFSHRRSMILWNDSHADLPIRMRIRESDAFSLASVEEIRADDIHDCSTIVSNVRSCKNYCEDSFTLPDSRRAALLITVLFNSPSLAEGETTKTIGGSLNVSLVPAVGSANLISVLDFPLHGKVGISSLLVRNNQNSDVTFVRQGVIEALEMFNAGTIAIQYKLYLAIRSDGKGELNLIPCNRKLFILDRSIVNLKPKEKATVKITFVPGVDLAESVKRFLVFESMYSTEIVDIVGELPASRCPSQQSVYSVESSSDPNEVMILASKKELSWGSVKIGESKIKNITFKNSSHNKKLRIIVAMTGDGYKVLSDNGLVPTLALTLQPQECRALHVEFKPAHEGGHPGHLKIVKRSNSEEAAKSATLFKVPLYGVGGNSILIFRDGVFRHAGAQGLPLGPLHDSGHVKEINFTIWNKGAAPGFVLFSIELKWKYRSLGNEVFITPSQAIVQPDDAVKCSVLIPRRAASLAGGQQVDTETVADLIVFHGDESNRLRIKRIRSQNDLDEDIWKQLTQGKLDRLCEEFPGEDTNYGNVMNFKETSAALKILLDEVQQKEVMITYDLNLDYSIAHLSNELDETLKFQSINIDSGDATTMQCI